MCALWVHFCCRMFNMNLQIPAEWQMKWSETHRVLLWNVHRSRNWNTQLSGGAVSLQLLPTTNLTLLVSIGKFNSALNLTKSFRFRFGRIDKEAFLRSNWGKHFSKAFDTFFFFFTHSQRICPISQALGHTSAEFWGIFVQSICTEGTHQLTEMGQTFHSLQCSLPSG